MYNIQKSKGVIYMKKVLFLLMILFGAFNSFSAHILNGKNSGMFTDKEMMSLVSGNYNTDVQLAVVSKARGSNQESTTKAENDARLTLQTTIKEYSYLVLTSYLKETGITGQDGSYLAELLLEKGYDEKYGARPLRRTIQKYIEDEIADLFIMQDISKYNMLTLKMLEKQVMIEKA